MVDIRNREIDDLIIEVIHTKPNETIEYTKRKFEFGGSEYMLCKEFFQDMANPKYCIPSMFSTSSNSRYFGWQKADLSKLDKDAYRPEHQKTDFDGPTAEGVDRYAISEAGQYDEAMNRVVWYRFVNDQESFLNKCRTLNYHQSTGVKRMLLQRHGFEYCGRRISSIPSCRDSLGYVGKDYGYEVWAQPHGVIVAISVAEGMVNFCNAQTFVKISGNYYMIDRARLSPDGGSMSYCYGETMDNDGTVVWYQSAPRFLWSLINATYVIPHWGEGVKGLHHLGLWTYNESEQYEKFEDFSNRVKRDVKKLAMEYPLLQQICCDAR